VADFPTNSLLTTLSAAAPPGTYYVRVRALNAAGRGEPSNEVRLVLGVVGPCAPPPPPTNVSGTAAATLLTLQWSPAAGATAYVIDAGSTPGSSNIASFDTGNSNTTFSANAPAGTYFIRLRARNGCGISAPSAEITVTIGASAPTPNVPPGIPALRVLGYTVTGSFGNAYIVGEVQNTGGGVATFVNVRATVTTPAGPSAPSTYVKGPIQRRMTRTGFVTSSSLAAGETGCFRIITNVPPSQLTVLAVDVWHSLTATDAPASRVEFATPVSTREAGGRLRWSGTLRNAGNIPTQFNSAVLIARNGGGQLLDCAPTFVRAATVTTGAGTVTDTGLLPGQSAPFDGISAVSPASVASMAFQVDWQADEAPALTAAITARPPALAALVAQRALLLARLDRLVARRAQNADAVTDEEVATVQDALEELTAHIETILAAQF
jgi:hypothetical protein